MQKYWIIIFLIITYCSLLTDEVSAEKSYLKLKTETDKTIDKTEYERIFMDHPDTFYGQTALLDLAKIELLQRNYDQALIYFKKIFHPDISTKEYWMAKCYLSKGDYDSAIISAQNYIYSSFDKEKIESSYFIIAEAYINKGLFVRALNTLKYLKNSENIQNNIPLLHYKMGYCNEKMGEYEQAITYYRKLKLDFPYHEYSYLAEDRIYDLKKENKINIDLKDILINETDQTVDDPLTYSLEKGSKYLQVGAFSKRINAENHAKEIQNTITSNYIIFEKIADGKSLFVVAFGPYEDDQQLKEVKQSLAVNGYNSFEIERHR